MIMSEKPICPSEPEILGAKGQIGFSDIIIDSDGVVRRALVSVQQGDEPTELSFAAKIALEHLKQQGIPLERAPDGLNFPWLAKHFGNDQYFRLGQIRFRALTKNDGGYVRVDTGGFQLLVNYRGDGPDNFFTIPMKKLMNELV